MMRTHFLIALFFAIICTSAGAATRFEASGPARLHVAAVVSAMTRLHARPSDRQANKAVNRAFERLLKDKSSAGDEALAALAGHNLGDSIEPECEILSRGKRMLPWLQRFDAHPPAILLSPSTAHPRAELIRQVQLGVNCDNL